MLRRKQGYTAQLTQSPSQAPGRSDGKSDLGLSLLALMFPGAGLWKLVEAAEAASVQVTRGLLALDQRRNTDIHTYVEGRRRGERSERGTALEEGK